MLATCQCAGSAAELSIVLVGAILRLDDQLAVSKVGIVNAVVLDLGNNDEYLSHCDRVWLPGGPPPRC